jgi:hypothetical protein
MAVQIDEVTAEVEPTPTAAPPAPSAPSAPAAPETELRKSREQLARLTARATRVLAD